MDARNNQTETPLWPALVLIALLAIQTVGELIFWWLNS